MRSSIAKATDEPVQPAVTDILDVSGSKTVVAIERAADILLHFGRSDRADLGVTDIANDLGMSKAAVHRVLASLRTRNLIVIDPETRRYSIGPSAMMLGLSACSGWMYADWPVLSLRRLPKIRTKQRPSRFGRATFGSMLIRSLRNAK